MGVHFLTQYRNPLAFPAGYAPGFDPLHPAARQTVMSSVNNGTNQVNLLKGVPATITGSIVTNMDAAIGPGTYFQDSNANYINFSGFSTAALDGVTFGCIFKIKGTLALYSYLISYGVNPGFHVFLSGGRVVTAEWGFVSSFASSFTIAVDAPYFLAVSSTNGGGVTDFYLLNLATGKLLTEFASAGSSTASTSASIYLGSSEWDHQVSKYAIATAAVMRAYTPRSAMLQWAADPWSFWYPNPGDNWVAAQAAAGGLFKITGNPRSLAGFGGGLAA